MKVAISILIGLVLSVSVSAKPLIEGRVRLDSGQPIANAKVQLFDMADLHRGTIAQATTDGAGYFALLLSALPEGFTLGLNYPNPFNPSTIIPYQLSATSQVRLDVFNLLGQRITTLVDGERVAGFHTATWTATDAAGRGVGAGVYVYRLTVGASSQTGRMVLVDGQAGVSGVATLGGDRSGEAGAQVYGLIVSGEGLAPYIDEAFRVGAGMAPVELVMSPGVYSAGKTIDDDCALCGLFDAFNNAEALTVYASVSDNTPTPGQVFALKARVQNQGTDALQNLVLSYYRSEDATISTKDMLLGTDEVGSLAASSTSREELISLTASSASGIYYYGACVTSVSGENNTTNRCSAGVRVVVASKDDLVSIPDANLRVMIENALGKARGVTITVAEMKMLDRLGYTDEGVSDLTGLEFASNLTFLQLSHNNIRDISPLAGLTKLSWLSFGSNNLTDISPLAGLTNLRILYLSHNNIRDISPLAGLTNLEELGLESNNLTDISPLAGLTNLEELGLESNNLTDISPLAGLTNLEELGLESNNLTDISSLTGLTNLRILYLGFNALNSFSINNHIATLEHNGTAVSFNRPLRESDFDIELVFISEFTQEQKRVIQYAARRWESIIREDLPDYTFTGDLSFQFNDGLYPIFSGERIDDLRIYVHTYNLSGGAGARGGPAMLREGETYMPVIGVVQFNFYYGDIIRLSTALHEIGHVLGIGTTWDKSNFLQNSSDDPHFNGPRAITAFNNAGGWGYAGKKVPVQKDGSHWRYFGSEVMNGASGPSLSAITIQALADLGYRVDVTQADPYIITLSDLAARASAKVSAHPDHIEPEWSCGVGQHQEPIYVVDPQGHIIRTLRR